MRTCPNPACPDRVSLDLAGEYVDSVAVCPQCGTPLMDATPATESPASAEAREVEMVCVLRTADEGLASLVKSMFDGDGIRYVVRGRASKTCSDGAASADSTTSSARPSFSFMKTTPTGRGRSCRQRHQAWRTNLPGRTTIHRRTIMCCCGLEVSRRQWLYAGLAASAASLLTPLTGRAQDDSTVQAVLRKTISLDAHSHAAGIIFNSPADSSLASGMKKGGLSAVCLASVPDGPVLGRGPSGSLAAVRQPKEGELYRYHLSRLDWMDELVAKHGVRRALTLADLQDAHAKGQPAIIGDVEGCDFLEGKLERLEEAHRRGVRVVQLVHYTANDLGDFQTGDVRHNGLSPFGAQVVRELNRLGAVVDIAHATETATRQAAKVATRPLLLSHTALAGSKAMGETRLAPRQVTPDHARVVADTGGVVALWHFYPTLDRYVDGLREMVDVIGVDHVGIGTDQQTTSGAVQNYGLLPQLTAAMLKKGFTPDEASKILGGNLVRVFGRSTGAA